MASVTSLAADHPARKSCLGFQNARGSCQVNINTGVVYRICATCKKGEPAGKAGRSEEQCDKRAAWVCSHGRHLQTTPSGALKCKYDVPCTACLATEGYCNAEQLAMAHAQRDKNKVRDRIARAEAGSEMVASRGPKDYVQQVAALAHTYGELMFPASELPRLRRGCSVLGDRVQLPPPAPTIMGIAGGHWCEWVFREWFTRAFERWQRTIAARAVRFGFPL